MKELLTHHPEAFAILEASVAENPDRIDNAYAELLGGYDSDPTTILKATVIIEPGSYNGTISSWNIPFLAFCAHHFVPFTGTIDVHYVPNTMILGIGKIPRLAKCRSSRFQLQEYLVSEIANDMLVHGDARAVEVTAMAKHICVCYRGPDEPTVTQTTSLRLGEVSQLQIRS
ncbi:MAG: GTP cyclohydrolase I [Pseudonocardiaceae bacterium]